MKNKTKFKQTKLGKISNDWKDKKISNCIELIYGEGLPETKRKKGNVSVFGSNGIIGFHDEALVKGPGVIIGRKGSVGEVAFSKSDFWPIDTTYYVKAKQGDDLIFWYYFLKTLRLNEMNSHSAVPGLNRNNVYEIIKPIPEIIEQRAIIKILLDLDEKIELNRQMNKTLESIAQTIFKHWFVDFEFLNKNDKPYKSSSGKMIDSELGKIPEGWKAGELKELIEITSGERPNEKSDKRDSEFSVPLLGASSIMGFVRETLYNEPVLIIGRVGTHGIVQRVLPPSFPSDNTLVIKTKFYEYVYQILCNVDYDSLNVGTTQPLITQSSIKAYRVMIPQKLILEKFENIIVKLYTKVNSNNFEDESLSQIRDSLLPKLMSGEIRAKTRNNK